MRKLFLAGPTMGLDPELVSYRFAAAKQRLQLEHPDAQIFNMATDLDTEPLLELALAHNLNPGDPVDRLRLLFSELLDSSAVYFMDGSDQDKLCNRLEAAAKEVGIPIYSLQSASGPAAPKSSSLGT